VKIITDKHVPAGAVYLVGAIRETGKEPRLVAVKLVAA
jgi:hypothetical protein